MKRAFFASIRFQIILLYLFILALTLFGLRFLLYTDFSRRLQTKLDTNLTLRAQGIEDSIRTYWRTEKLEMTKEWPTEHFFFKKKDDNFEQIATQLTASDLEGANEILDISLIFDFKGELIATSQPLTNVEQFKNLVVATVLNKKPTYTTFKKANLFETVEIPIRVISKPIIELNEVKYVVVVMVALAPLHKELNELQNAFMMQIPIVLFVAIIGALLLVEVILNPVDEMVHTIRRIKPDTLKLRLKVPRTGDEIARLAETFNDMLEELERSFLAQRQIVQDISHELKTPLTVLRGQQEVALRRDRDTEEYKALLMSNLEEIDKMKRLVYSMLLLAKFDKDAQLLEMVPVDLRKLAGDVVDDMRPIAATKNIEVNTDVQSARIMVDGNETYLRHLLANLLDNAIKYTSQNGKITLKLNKDKFFVYLAIQDTGIGIADKDLPFIFDRFYRIDKSRTGGDGFGLGLSIVKSIINLHKGDIKVTSKLGQGTTFNILLPVVHIS